MHHKHTWKRGTQKYLRENYYHRIECIAAIFLAAFMWKRPLNSAALITTTHKKLRRVSDGTDTQLRAQIKYRIKIVQRKLYNIRNPPWGRIEKKKENTVTIQNYTCNRFNWFIWKLISSDSKFIQLYDPCSCLIIFWIHTTNCQIH